MSTWLDAYIDGELEPDRAAELDSHVRQCDRCAASVDERRQLRAALSAGLEHRAAPWPMRASILQSLGLERATGHTRKTPGWAWIALAACIALGFTTLWMARQSATTGGTGNVVLREAVSSHIRSLMAAHLMDVASSDQHTVKPWYAGKLDFAPSVVDLSAKGFPLAGGRLDYLDGRPVAALVYNRRAHLINLFIWPARSPEPEPVRSLDDRGYHVMAWSDGLMQYCAVSDVSRDDLAALVAELPAGR